jgi:hypothetical protein
MTKMIMADKQRQTKPRTKRPHVAPVETTK